MTTPTKSRPSGLLIGLIAIGILLLAIGAFALLQKPAGVPAIAAEPARIDFGKVPYGQQQTILITVTNTGSAPLAFAAAPSIEVLEGC